MEAGDLAQKFYSLRMLSCENVRFIHIENARVDIYSNRYSLCV